MCGNVQFLSLRPICIKIEYCTLQLLWTRVDQIGTLLYGQDTASSPIRQHCERNTQPIYMKLIFLETSCIDLHIGDVFNNICSILTQIFTFLYTR